MHPAHLLTSSVARASPPVSPRTPSTTRHQSPQLHPTPAVHPIMQCRRRLAGWVVLLAFLAISYAPSASLAQFFAGVYEEPLAITEQELAGFNRVLATTPVQQDAAKALADAAKADLKEQEAKQSKVFAAWQALPKDRRTPDARQRFIQDVSAAEPDVAGARKRLFADLKALLTEAQHERWIKFESFVRRARWMDHPTGWDTQQKANMIALVDRLALDDAALAPVVPMLDRYERQLDTALTDLEREHPLMMNAMRGISQREQESGGQRDVQARKAASAEHTRVHRGLMDLNDDCLRRISAAIPEEKSKILRQTYDRVTLPGALGMDPGYESIKAAPQLSGLSDETRQKVAGIAYPYLARYDEITPKIAALERQFRRAEPDDNLDRAQWDSLRMERSNLTGTAVNALRELLTERQWETMLHVGRDKKREWDESMVR